MVYVRESTFLSTYLDKNFIRERPDFALSIAARMCSLKDSFWSIVSPMWVVDSTLATGIPPKVTGGCSGLFVLFEKIISTACLLMSGLNFIFH